MSEIIESLHTNKYVEIPGLSDEMKTALFSTFSKLVDNSRDALRSTRIDGTGRGYGRGGFREVPPEVKEDGQDFSVGKNSFIYDPANRSTWQQSAASETSGLIELCDAVYAEAITVVRGIAGVLDTRYPGTTDLIFDTDDQPNARLVVARYNRPEPKDNNRLFGSHRDESFLSTHLGDTDTDPGFYFTDESRQLNYYDLQDGHGVLFAGKQWAKHNPESPLKPLFHGVQLPESVVGVERMSAVLFVDPVGFSR